MDKTYMDSFIGCETGAKNYDPHLVKHIINVGDNGRQAEGNLVKTPIAEHIETLLDAMATQFRSWEMLEDGIKAQLLFFSHGGLIGEAAGLHFAAGHYQQCLKCKIYPVFFIWKTGFEEILRNILIPDQKILTADPLIEEMSAPLGQAIWTQMKSNAEQASDTNDGVAYLFMKALAQRIEQEEVFKNIQIHFLGHSAGCIFDGAMIKRWHDEFNKEIASCTLLAPAITIDYFQETYLPALGDNRIGQFYMATLTDEAEQADNVVFYQKSLLYLVSNAFEKDPKTPLLGMEKYSYAQYGWDLSNLSPSMYKQGRLHWAHLDMTTSPRVTSHGGFATLMFTSIIDRIHASITMDTRALIQSKGIARQKALLVGINDYPGGNELRGCVNDVNNMAELLLEQYQFGLDDIQTLTDARATKSAIMLHLEWLIASAQPGDRLLFYFSGHGTQIALPSNTPGYVNSLHEVICPIDFDWSEEHAIFGTELVKLFSRVPTNVEFIWISDSCNSGGLFKGQHGFHKQGKSKAYSPNTDMSWALRKAKDKAMLPIGFKDIALHNQVALMAACEANENTQDVRFGDDTNFQGAFTYYMIRRIKQNSAKRMESSGKRFHKSMLSSSMHEPKIENEPIKTLPKESGDFLGQDLNGLIYHVEQDLIQNHFNQTPRVFGSSQIIQTPFMQAFATLLE